MTTTVTKREFRTINLFVSDLEYTTVQLKIR